MYSIDWGIIIWKRQLRKYRRRGESSSLPFLRRTYGIKPGSLVKIREEDNKIVLEPEKKNPVEECFGKYAREVSLTEALLIERKEEKSREEKKALRI